MNTPSTISQRIAPLEADHFWFVARDELFSSLIRRIAPSSGSILDVGCGTGRFAATVAQAGFGVTALDLVVPSRSPRGVQLVEGSVASLPFRSASFDGVLARDVLEHVDDRAALAEFHRVARPGGVLVVAVPGWPSLWGQRDIRAGHLRRYRRAELVRRIRSAGFRVREVRGYPSTLLPLFLLARRVLPSQDSTALEREERLPRAVNRLLLAITRAEISLARWPWLRPPTGSSLIVIAEALP